MDNKKTPKNPTIFICEKCDFKSSNKKDYKRHLGTAKHKWKQMEPFGTKKHMNAYVVRNIILVQGYSNIRRSVTIRPRNK